MDASPDAIRREIECALPRHLIDRAIIVEQTESTQDLALSRCANRPGLAVIALNQTRGRGRLGASWHDPAGRGLAMTLVLPGALDAGTLSLAAGIAVCRACEDAGARTLALRWPNDVVERAAERKIAGILIEKREGLYLAGFGVNLAQREEDFPPDLRPRAASLAMLGADPALAPRIGAVLHRLAEALGLAPAALAQAWVRRDMLVGTRRTFEHAGRRTTGIVEAIDPASQIVVRTGESVVCLPALTTRLVPWGRSP